MRKYSDYQEDKSKNGLTEDEFKKVKWTHYKIVVPTKEDKDELIKAFKYIHDCFDIDKDNIIINQLSHEYYEEDTNNIIVDEDVFKNLK